MGDSTWGEDEALFAQVEATLDSVCTRQSLPSGSSGIALNRAPRCDASGPSPRVVSAPGALAVSEPAAPPRPAAPPKSAPALPSTLRSLFLSPGATPSTPADSPGHLENSRGVSNEAIAPIVHGEHASGGGSMGVDAGPDNAASSPPPARFLPPSLAPSSRTQPPPHPPPPSDTSPTPPPPLPAPNPLLYGSVELCSTGCLELRMGYHETIWRALRGLAVCTWVPERRTWSFPLAAHDAVLAALGRASGVRTRVEPLPPVAAAVLGAQGRWTDESARGGSLPAQLSSALLPFQKQGLAFALSRGGRCLVGDEMGLGKTVQALAAAACFREEWPLLVLAPSSLREAWAEALHRWLGLEAGQVLVAQSGRDAARVAQVAADGVRGGILACVVSYSLAPKLDAGDATLGSFSGGSLPRKKAKKGLSASSAPSSALSPLPTWRVVIADEAHYLKDASSQRSLAVVPLLKAARRAFLLTGTPALNKPKELFPLLSALLPDASLRMKDFGERYCAGTRWDRYGGACNLTELHALLQTVMIRRLKRDVLPQLPRKRRQQVLLALDAPARRELGALGSRMERASAALAAAEARGGGLRAGGEDGALVMELYRRSAELKVPAVQEYVRMLLEAGTKCIIFAHHTALLDGVEHELRRFAGARRGGAAPGASFVRITGSTPAGERQALVDRFQQREEVRVALLSIKAAGVGLTLTAASVVVFAELTWTPGEVVQAEDRAHRIGQASAVNVYFLHAKGSIDDLIWAAIQSKLEAVGQVLDGVEGGMELEGGVRAAPDRRQRLLAPMLNANKGGGS